MGKSTISMAMFSLIFCARWCPPSYKWIVIPETTDISPTKTIVKLDLSSPTERVHELGHHLVEYTSCSGCWNTHQRCHVDILEIGPVPSTQVGAFLRYDDHQINPNHPFIDGIVHQPTIFWDFGYPHDYGTPQVGTWVYAKVGDTGTMAILMGTRAPLKLWCCPFPLLQPNRRF